MDERSSFFFTADHNAMRNFQVNKLDEVSTSKPQIGRTVPRNVTLALNNPKKNEIFDCNLAQELLSNEIQRSDPDDLAN